MKSALVMLDPKGAEFCEGTFVQRLHKIISTNFHVSSFVKNQFRTWSSLQHLKGNLVFFIFLSFFLAETQCTKQQKSTFPFFSIFHVFAVERILYKYDPSLCG